MVASLFHVTRSQDASAIAADGLRKSADRRVEKVALEAGGMDEWDPMVEESPDMKADRRFDELVADGRREVGVPSEWPRHDNAVFFWATQERAYDGAENTAGSNVIVAVDPEKMDPSCTFLAGPIDIADDIWTGYYDLFRDTAGNPDEDRLFDLAEQFWREVHVYEGNAARDIEVWTGCDVPPGAIEHITDPETGRVLYDPVDADQTTLREFGP